MSLRRLALPIVVLALLAVPATGSAATTSSDLAVSTTAPATVQEQQNFNITLTATNNGPDPAQNVELVFTIPSGSAFVTFVNITQGSGTYGSGLLTADFGTLAAGGSASISLTLDATARGTIQATPSVGFNTAGSQVDPDQSNNSITTDIVVTGITAVMPSFADQSLGTLGAPQTVLVTNNSSQAVTFGPLPVSGAAASDYLTFANTCSGATIAAGASCTLVLRFAPSELGARNATIDLAPASGPIDPLVLDLTGNGIPLPVNTGPQGPAGAQGPQGSQGPQGQPAFKLVLASAVKRLVASRGRAVTLAYASTLKAHVVLDVLKGRKRVALITGRARQGANRIRWNGRHRGKAVRAGRYTLRLIAKNGDQTTTLAVQLKLR